jgi:hypothetical protein
MKDEVGPCPKLLYFDQPPTLVVIKHTHVKMELYAEESPRQQTTHGDEKILDPNVGRSWRCRPHGWFTLSGVGWRWRCHILLDSRNAGSHNPHWERSCLAHLDGSPGKLSLLFSGHSFGHRPMGKA